jgi:hypothetical protein
MKHLRVLPIVRFFTGRCGLPKFYADRDDEGEKATASPSKLVGATF